METPSFAGWCILELLGHRRLAGYVTEHSLAGAGFLRIDIPGNDSGVSRHAATQFYPPSSVYCLTPCGEAEARAVARLCQPQPVQRWEMPALPEPLDDHTAVINTQFEREHLHDDDKEWDLS